MKIIAELRWEKALRMAAKIGLHHQYASSNLLTPTNFSGFLASKTHFFSDNKSMSDSKAKRKIKRKPVKSLSGYPYRPARLVPESMDITKQWYIVFYAWDIGKEKLERKRVLQDEFQELTTLEARVSMAEGIIEEINYFLKHDWHLFSSPAPEIVAADFSKYTILDAFKYSLTYLLEVRKISADSVKKYEQVVATVKEFLSYKKLTTSYALRNLNKAFAQSYFEYIATERKNANSTYNFKKGTLTTLVNVLIEVSPKTFGGINPFSGVRKLKTQSRKHAAFTTDQLKRLINLATEKKAFQISLFIQFMYYTLGRGKELAAMKVGHIHIAMRRILFHVDAAKTDIEEYVGIPDRLAEIIQDNDLLRYPQNYYIFSNEKKYYVNLPERMEITEAEFNGMSSKEKQKANAEMVIYHGPGPKKVGKNYFYKRITEMFTELGFYDVNPNHTPYSVKHTGAINLYLATRNINIVQRQCRHEILETTIKYLRDLGVFTDFDELNKMKAAI